MASNLTLVPILKECETIKLQEMNLLLRDQQNICFYNEEEEDSNEEDDEYEHNEEPMCGCGTPLSSGWDCAQCRHNCTTCHRALILGEECSRCNVEHNTKSMTTLN